MSWCAQLSALDGWRGTPPVCSRRSCSRLDSLIALRADAHRVEAGGALAVDRVAFAAPSNEKIKNHPNIEVVYGEVTGDSEGRVVIASGPLTSDTLFDAIRQGHGDFLHFYDAAAPIVTARASIWIPPTRLPATARAPQITSTGLFSREE